MKERRIYTLLGLLLLVAVGYLNWSSSGGGGGGGGVRIPIPWLQPKMGFVGRNGTRFVDLEDGSPVYVNGWNSYWLMSSDSSDPVVEMLRLGRAMGMSVCRTWAFSDGGPNALQIYPGHFDERIFQVLDLPSYLLLHLSWSHVFSYKVGIFEWIVGFRWGK
ncbi:hypothetical protein BHE74_00020533 [Ensete ventricosum]|uniref:Mannan endo-1,4-beta-mannosidase n=1 Tax=Ensete ventricosum TaxID=4639 RepID=A0A426XMY4_ENSVE|nr:hypothetical protein B296_00044313 [Ensete ventricosum]RWW71699.1 hypothetical protein BHE74_00020533 [Ensete ventricosum]RZS18976.1 hypothetical protein BHM03_00051314 [Ensete ventricosum]